MALPPKFSGHRLPLGDAAASSAPHAGVHTIELYLDYVCPFSASMKQAPIHQKNRPTKSFRLTKLPIKKCSRLSPTT